MRRFRPAAALLAMAVMIAPILTAACGASVHASMDDATITTRVKTILLNDPDVGALRINVETFQGVVTLSGSVKSKDEEQKAIALAHRIDGVKDVKSTLQIAPGGTPTSLRP